MSIYLPDGCTAEMLEEAWGTTDEPEPMPTCNKCRKRPATALSACGGCLDCALAGWYIAFRDALKDNDFDAWLESWQAIERLESALLEAA